MVRSIEQFKQISVEPRFQGWPLVSDFTYRREIPFFGQAIEYELETPHGREKYFSILRSFGWCVVFGITEDQNVITLVQWKPGVNQASWELPPGGIGMIHPGASSEFILERTKETYLKETGYGGGEWIRLGALMIETGKYRGVSPNDHGLPAYLMMATGLARKQDARSPNPNEIMESLLVSLDEFPQVLESDFFIEASAVACGYRALKRLGR